MEAALAPVVRCASSDAARARAQGIRAAAAEDARAELAHARQEATRVLAEARTAGTEAADATAAAQLAVARREARETHLDGPPTGVRGAARRRARGAGAPGGDTEERAGSPSGCRPWCATGSARRRRCTAPARADLGAVGRVRQPPGRARAGELVDRALESLGAARSRRCGREPTRPRRTARTGVSRGSGRVVRVNGPLVEVEGLDEVAVADVVEVGDAALAAEVVSVRRRPGHRPGLRVHGRAAGRGPAPRDWAGRCRPASAPACSAASSTACSARWPDRRRGSRRARSGRTAPQRRWRFVPVASPGAAVAPGTVLGTVPTSSGVDHRVLVPRRVAWRRWSGWPTTGDVDDEGAIAIVGRTRLSGSASCGRSARHVRSRARLEPLGAADHRPARGRPVLFPIAKGATAAVPGGFGTGKTVLLQQIVKWCEADVIVFVGCGERGNELADALAELAAARGPADRRHASSSGRW